MSNPQTRNPLCLTFVTAFLLAALTVVANDAVKETNWPQWRGPESSGVAPESNLGSRWSETENIVWKKALPGRGHSSPIIWGNRVFLTTAIEGPVVEGASAPEHLINGKLWKHPDSVGADRQYTLKLLALDASNGKLVWERIAYEGTIFDDRHRRNTYATPTPVTDGKLVYAYFGTEGLYAYDFSGKPQWKYSPGKIPTLGMGVGTSPVLYGNLLILQCDRELGEDSFIVALNKNTGKEVWKTPRKVQVSWSTPVIVRGPGRDELVTSGNEWIIAYDPRTGKELWRTKGLESNAIPTPVVGHGLVIVSAGFPKKKVVAIRPGGVGDITGTPHIVWSYDRGTAYVPSPVLYGDHLYLISDNGILTCLDARTGQVLYANGRVPVPATFMASLVAVDGKILQFSEDGDTFVVKAGPKHELLDTNSLGEPIYSTPAIAAGRLYIRAERHLYCINLRAGPRLSAGR